MHEPGVSSRPMALQQIWLWLLVGALCNALTHYADVWLRHTVLGRLAWAGADFLWMAPLSYVVMFALAAGLPLTVVALVRPQWVTGRLAAGVMIFLAVLGTLVLYPAISKWASVLVALGVAVRLSSVLSARASRSPRALRTAALALTLFFVAVGGGSALWRDVSARRAVAVLPARNSAPNVLLVIWDTVRQQNVSTFGYPRETSPNLTRLAAEGTAFDWAFSNAPWTLPSHSAMFTGRYPGELSGDWLPPLDRTSPTVAELLQSAGYETAGFVANLNYCTRETGLDRGFIHYAERRRTFLELLHTSSWGQLPIVNTLLWQQSPQGALRAIGEFNLTRGPYAVVDVKSATVVADQFLDWEARRDRQHPYFAFLNFIDAHDAPDFRHFFDTTFTGSAQGTNDYDAAIHYMDSQLGRMLAELRARGSLENTIVVVTSDHGEHMRDHGQAGGHGVSLYTQVLRVPLVVSWPGHVPPGFRIGQQAETRDLAQTLLDLTGVTDRSHVLGGASLRRYWTADSSLGDQVLLAELSRGIRARKSAPNAKGALKSLVDADRHYILRRADNNEELFDYRQDPLELHNIASDSAESARLILMRQRMSAIRLPWREPK